LQVFNKIYYKFKNIIIDINQNIPIPCKCVGLVLKVQIQNA